MKQFWCAHVRGPYFDRLRKLGFVVLYPAVDDYVFLEVSDENRKLVSRQQDLGIFFLKRGRRLQTISEAELENIQERTTEKLEIGAPIIVVGGYCEALEGKIMDENGQKVRCELQGYTRTYDVWIDKLDVALGT